MSNQKIILLAETGADIPKEWAEELGIYIVPMHVNFGSETKADGTFPADDVVTYYKETGNLPKTSGSTPGDFEILYDRIHEEHPDAQILYMAYSACTTCSYQSGMIASEDRNYITAMDTKQVSVGQCVSVITMAKLLKEHPEWDIETAKQKAIEVSESVHMCFVPDTLEFLRAGGRVSNGAAIAGSLLKIHPRIEIIDGKLIANKKLRGRLSKIVPSLVTDYIAEQDLSLEEIWLIYAPGTSSEVMQVAENAAKEAGAKKVTWVRTGGVITTHGGPGAFGMVGIRK